MEVLNINPLLVSPQATEYRAFICAI